MDNHRQSDNRQEVKVESKQLKNATLVQWRLYLASAGLLIACVLVLEFNQRKTADRTTGTEVAENAALIQPHTTDSKTAATILHRADDIPTEVGKEPAKPAGYLDGQPTGRILIVRGIFTVFSLGLDDLAKKLQDRGYDVQVTTAAGSNFAARQLRDSIYSAKDKSPLIIIGHSLGGDLAPMLAQTFAEKSVPVDMLIMLDSTMPTSPPVNVKRCVNLYQSNATPEWARLFRGANISAKSQNTELINIDIRKIAGKDKTAGINHFNIDANPWIHDLIIDAVKQADPGPGPAVANAVGISNPNQPVRNVRLPDQPILTPQRKFNSPALPGQNQAPIDQRQNRGIQ